MYFRCRCISLAPPLHQPFQTTMESEKANARLHCCHCQRHIAGSWSKQGVDHKFCAPGSGICGMTVAVSFCVYVMGLPMLCVWLQTFTCSVGYLVAFSCGNNPGHQNLGQQRQHAGVRFDDYGYHSIRKPPSIHHYNLSQPGD